MKKLIVLFVFLAITASLAITPVFAGGGKVRGEVGQGAVNQEGSNSQGNQAG